MNEEDEKKKSIPIRSLTEEEEEQQKAMWGKEEIINPYRLPKMEEDNEPTAVQGWTPISEKFECHSCGGPKFNGYEKYGTRICLDCKEGIDAQNL